MAADGAPPVEWEVSDRPMAYEAALAAMTARADAIARGQAGELVWLLEHPALYTAGTSARPAELAKLASSGMLPGLSGLDQLGGAGAPTGAYVEYLANAV